MLERLHIGHAGIEWTVKKARSIVFWLGISSDIRKFVLKCLDCVALQNPNPREPQQLSMTAVATDIFEWDRKDFLVVVD